jgi:hypothetical protein
LISSNQNVLISRVQMSSKSLIASSKVLLIGTAPSFDRLFHCCAARPQKATHDNSKPVHDGAALPSQPSVPREVVVLLDQPLSMSAQL